MSVLPWFRGTWSRLAVVVLAAGVGACAKQPPQAAPEPPAPLEVPVPPPRVLAPVSLPEPLPPPAPAAPPTEPARPPRPRTGPPPRPPVSGEPNAEAPKTDPAPAEGPQPPPPAQEPARPPAEASTPGLKTPQTANDAEAERRVREVLGRASKALESVNRAQLSQDARAQFDTVRRFVDQSSDALRARNYMFAAYLADKAETLANGLTNR